jgi:hypothetical protein
MQLSTAGSRTTRGYGAANAAGIVLCLAGLVLILLK